MLIRDLFRSDVTRDIAPVVYFHEQSPGKLQAEVSEYIITGGWPEEHPNHQRVPSGIHEAYVSLLTTIAKELDRPGGPDLPTCWISGFYGSGKSSFAKLLGLALDGVPLPSGQSLAEAWLARDTSPKAQELKDAWQALRQKIEPIAVVFDIGGIARDHEHIHAAAVRQVQQRLGYCSTDPIVAEFELKLERDREWERFEQTALEVLGKPWSDVKDNQLAEEDFSLVQSVLFPDRYSDPMAWYTSRGGKKVSAYGPDDAAKAIRDMIGFRKEGATLFLVVDEVSQYVLANKDRVDRLRAFASALGTILKGRAWLMALGQQKLDEDADESFLVWAKDRFPPKLRVHLAASNIRDVVHKRLLQKKAEHESTLRALFDQHRPDLKLYAYQCESLSPEDFVEFYPMLPSQIDLILQITTALRTRSTRAQGDDQSIRGLLQLLGELFRDQELADQEVGALVTLDQIYEVQHTALDSDVQASMARVFNQCAGEESAWLVRAAKAVALLELIQDTIPTTAGLVAQCLYDRLDRGNQVAAVTEALEALRRKNLLGYSEKQGYKIQSTAGEEWERERRDIGVPREAIVENVQEGLKYLLGTPERPRLGSRTFPWAGLFSDGRRAENVKLVDPRDEAVVQVDFRQPLAEDRTRTTWVKRSDEPPLRNRLVWVVGPDDELEDLVRELQRSRGLVRKYKPRRESLTPARKLLLQQEENRVEELEQKARQAIAQAWMGGKLFFRGRSLEPKEQGQTFAVALTAAGNRVLPDLYPHFLETQIQPAELQQLLGDDLTGPSQKFVDLEILSLDGGRYVPSCSGEVPSKVKEVIEDESGISGGDLLQHFGGPPYGYTPNVVKACVIGLLRNSQVRIQAEGLAEIHSFRDAGARDLFEKDRPFKRATIFPAGEDDIGPQARAKICKFFRDHLGLDLDREDHHIADAVQTHFPALARRLRDVLGRYDKIPVGRHPEVYVKLTRALEQCLQQIRQTLPTVQRVKKQLDVLRDGVERLRLDEAELTEEAMNAVRRADDVIRHHVPQLRDLGIEATNIEAAAVRIEQRLGTERPWREIAELDQPVSDIRAAYRAERASLLQRQEEELEAARARVKRREGFSTLTADQAHQVLRPLTEAATTTDEESIAPTLVSLRDTFTLALRSAEDQANEILDVVLSKGEKPLIVRVDLNLRNREVTSEADVEALVEEIRARLLEKIREGARVRLQ